MVTCVLCEIWLLTWTQPSNCRDEQDEDRTPCYEEPKRYWNVSGNSRPKPSRTYNYISPDSKEKLSYTKNNGKYYSRNYRAPDGILPKLLQSLTSNLLANAAQHARLRNEGAAAM